MQWLLCLSINSTLKNVNDDDMNKLECDYLVVGSGAVGMAFADVLVEETDAKVIIVDRYAKPGGHWNLSLIHISEPTRPY